MKIKTLWTDVGKVSSLGSDFYISKIYWYKGFYHVNVYQKIQLLSLLHTKPIVTSVAGLDMVLNIFQLVFI